MTATEPRIVDAPREDLVRMSTVRFDEAGDGNTLVGYAAVFNEPTVIDSWEGHFVERIAPGAFRKTLRERGDLVKVLFNHGMDPSIGDKPLGKPTVMKEDERGLYVEVPLSDTSYNADIKALLRDGALDGMSFRMTVTKEKWDDPTDARELPERTIMEIRLYELGPVTFQAYEATQVGIRSHAPAAFEAWRAAHEPPALRTEQTDPEAPSGDPDETEGEPAPDPEPAAATRDDEAATTGTPSDPYQPAQRPTLTPERRESQRGLVKALYAQFENRNP